MSQADALTLEIAPGPRALDDIAEVLHRAWSGNPQVPDDVRTHVGVAVGEIGANILEHASPGWIRLEVRVLADRVQVDLFDDGRPNDVDLAAAVLPDAMAERGRGIALAQSTLEQLSYSRDTVNRWTLVSKRFG